MGGLPIYKQCFGQTLRYLSVFTKRKGMSSFDLLEEYELKQMTCWTFKWKIQQAMKSSCSYPLKGEVHVDEHISKDANIITDE